MAVVKTYLLPPMLSENETLLEAFRKAIQKNGPENIVDLDNNLKHKFDFEVYRFEDVLLDTGRTIPPNRWSYHRIGLIKKGPENSSQAFINSQRQKIH